MGLEYRELQHILSLGTFKKTYFFAAHSDALMLQWGDNIEKVKNALDGESEYCVYMCTSAYVLVCLCVYVSVYVCALQCVYMCACLSVCV